MVVGHGLSALKRLYGVDGAGRDGEMQGAGVRWELVSEGNQPGFQPGRDAEWKAFPNPEGRVFPVCLSSPGTLLSSASDLTGPWQLLHEAYALTKGFLLSQFLAQERRRK